MLTIAVTDAAGHVGSHVVDLLRDASDAVLAVDDPSLGVRSRIAGVPLVGIDIAWDCAPELADVGRAGDPASFVADVGRISDELGWRARHGLTDVVASAVEAARVGAQAR